jgi:glycine cleavage system protein P-like pyridoxal-binding family
MKRVNDYERTEMLIPSAAHGTNPATAVMCGYKVREIPVLANGDVDLAALKAAVGPQTAGLMMTNPSTCGVFEQQVEEIAKACTMPAACCTTTAPTSMPFSARCVQATWASTCCT